VELLQPKISLALIDQITEVLGLLCVSILKCNNSILTSR